MARSALDTALGLLARRDYLREELRSRLARKRYSEDEIDAALERCAELGYLDDLRAGRRYAELAATRRGWSPRRIEWELRRRGIDEASAARLAVLTPEELATALQTTLQRAERRAPQRWWRAGDARARMVTSLVGRGFDPDDAARAVDELAARRENADDASDEKPGDPIDLP